MLEQLDENIWIANQPQKYHGLEIGTRMTIIRFNANELLLISPVKLTNILKEELSVLGDVKYIFAPNIYHHLYLEACCETYPNAKIYVALGLEFKYSALRCNVLTADVPEELRDSIEQIPFDGYAVLEISGSVVLNEVVFFHKESKTVILTDSAFHFVPTGFFTKFFAKLFGLYNVLGPSILEKWAIKEPQKTKRALEKVMEWPFEMVVMAHGEIIREQGKKKLELGYKWLLNEPRFN